MSLKTFRRVSPMSMAMGWMKSFLFERPFLKGLRFRFTGSVNVGWNTLPFPSSIGLAYRWLNPVGVADFDADGEMDVAVVEMPHLGRSLVIYSRTASRLIERGRLSGFSNHHMGSTIIDLSVAFDVNHDGVVDMILPDEERRFLQAMTFKGGEFKRIAEGPVGAAITTSVVAGDFNGNGAIDFVYGRADGTIEAVFR